MGSKLPANKALPMRSPIPLAGGARPPSGNVAGGSAPVSIQRLAEQFVLGALQVRVGVEELLGLGARLLDQWQIGEARHAQTGGVPGLACAQEFAWTALLQVALSEEEAIIGLRHSLQAFVLGAILT